MKQKKLFWAFFHFMSPQWNKKKTALLLLGTFVFSIFNNWKQSIPVHAAANSSVVINEIAWAGSEDSKSDEWIELYNTSNQDIDLSNWSFSRGKSAKRYKISTGSILAHGYFLVEDHESAVSTVNSDAIINLSLANGGTTLKLYDNNDQVVDIVNSSGDTWPAGDGTTKATMERIDPLVSGNQGSNWTTSIGSTDKASGNSSILGTPKKLNTVGGPSSGGNQPSTSTSKIEISFDSNNPKANDILTATVQASNVKNLFSYGIDLNYDPAVLHFKAASEQDFLNDKGSVSTSFQAGLENQVEGKLVVAGARTNSSKATAQGSGKLFTVQFQVINNAAQSALHFGSTSFLGNSNSDIAAKFIDQKIDVQSNVEVSPISNLQITEGSDRYSMNLSWSASANATSYRIFRQDPHGKWVLLQELNGLTFVDKDGVKNGGAIIPKLNYNYQVVGVNGSNESSPLQATQKDSRGLKGDNNRSDRVDGRDLENLARHFGEIDTDNNFDNLNDSTYDGIIDGNDLIDLGANFALKYS